jgi:hypothetical protein
MAKKVDQVALAEDTPPTWTNRLGSTCSSLPIQTSQGRAFSTTKIEPSVFPRVHSASGAGCLPAVFVRLSNVATCWAETVNPPACKTGGGFLRVSSGFHDALLARCRQKNATTNQVCQLMKKKWLRTLRSLVIELHSPVACGLIASVRREGTTFPPQPAASRSSEVIRFSQIDHCSAEARSTLHY